ncbi:MAG TPA: pyridoxamine 5'-phosphate oxidase family protein [Candidatus Limnocylindrales bacterium]|jgi:PPOX class probable F420-dependent enzyme|nr:pyridoxamine 5'-phosphate oxidase family protein [Candidatus Limnocylindrales bacterium]
MTQRPDQARESPTQRPLPDHIRTFLDDLRFATISTTDADGRPRQAVVWYTLDGAEVVINSAIGRRWPANLVRDPRLSFTVIDAADQYRWVGLTGTVRSITDWTTTQADIAAMARRYHADEPDEAERLIHERFERQDRISFRFRAMTIHDELDA